MLIYTRHDPRYFDRRLHKGGGDGGAADMRRQEEDRQRQVQAGVDAINAKFGYGTDYVNRPAPVQSDYLPASISPFRGGVQQFGEGVARYNQDKAAYDAGVAQGGTPIADAAAARRALYGDVAGATRDMAMRDLDRQFTQASRQNTYGLADAGLLGGSADAESNGDLQTRYGEGRMKAVSLGQRAAADLENQDEQTRQRLIQLAQSGLDTGTAASLAAGQLKSAADLAGAQATTASVGNLFGDMTQAYMNNKYLAARYPNGLPQGQQTGYTSSAFAPTRYVGDTK